MSNKDLKTVNTKHRFPKDLKVQVMFFVLTKYNTSKSRI